MHGYRNGNIRYQQVISEFLDFVGGLCRTGLMANLPYFFGYKTEFFLPKQSQRSRSVLQDGSRSFGLFRKGKIGIIAKFHLVI